MIDLQYWKRGLHHIVIFSRQFPSAPHHQLLAFATMVSIPECPPICLHQLIELCVLVNLEK